MPELPEVETVVRTIAPHVEGRRILAAEFFSDLVLRHAKHPLHELLPGRAIQQVRRRGKHIVFTLDQGLLIVHLGMTGKLLLHAEPGPHTRAIFTLDDSVLLYNDSRMFGSIEWCEDLPPRMERLGPEPFDIDATSFVAGLKNRKTSIKALLMNQTLVRGLGNIYVDEALFRAGIRPATVAAKIGKKRALALHAAMLEVLNEAIHHKGSSISDYVDGKGARGSFQDRHNVYGREGKPCRNCGSTIRKTVLAQRGTHYCPRCQR